MGNKPSVSEGEDEEERQSVAQGRAAAPEITNGGGEDVDEELEVPPPMKPIQEPIVFPSPPPGVPGVPEIEGNTCKGVSVGSATKSGGVAANLRPEYFCFGLEEGGIAQVNTSGVKLSSKNKLPVILCVHNE